MGERTRDRKARRFFDLWTDRRVLRYAGRGLDGRLLGWELGGCVLLL